ncbi:glutamate-5-semialdehyde dehydrogenase [Collinsella vaginalis]|uniref:glutamate-5-semialdehyde dehydrogenase n=1 Tax=Collinsella vaginalis TaxID=1870987 RepID=UPI000A26A751|nr:glutamate-5-semialdehyde dehydrogenase [Collinsella vaginalis]
MQDVATYVEELARAAKAASRPLGFTSDEARQAAVRGMAQALRDHASEILDANALDMEAAREKGTSEGMLDRLLLTPERMESMAQGLESLASLPDPVGRVLEHRTNAAGLDIKKVSVPLGLVAMVYEARPNVTADAAGICIRTGNACILRGGSLAEKSCVAIAHVLADAVAAAGLPREAVSIIETTDRAATGALMTLRGTVDLLIPRGGAGLIQRCVRESLIPVIETGTGNCHIYVHASADFDHARAIILNAKTQRVGVCNAAESILVDNEIAADFLPLILTDLARAGVLVHGDAATRGAAVTASAGHADAEDSPLAHFVLATEEDWGREYLALEISSKVVADEDEAIAHINRYGTGHSEAIIAEDAEACARFLREVDAAAVYANASTRFTDGGEFGLGAEIGISTQKLHARGPFAAEALTTWKYEITGAGQVRP